MTRVTLGKSRVRESRTPGSVRAKAEWLSYSTVTHYPTTYQRYPVPPLLTDANSAARRLRCPADEGGMS